MLLYSPLVTNRLTYIAGVIFEAIGAEKFEITTNLQAYLDYKGPGINYSEVAISQREIWITPVALLFEEHIKPHDIEVFLWQGLPAFYKSSGQNLPFDIFAASFYLLSRYEEYLPHQLDVYGRYAHENSLAFKKGFLQLPLVNLWLKELVTILHSTFPDINLKPASFTYLPTYDIDIAWSYLNKGWIRNMGGLARSMLKGEWSTAKERLRVLQQKQRDPFDSYNWLDTLHKNFGLQPLYFFLLAAGTKGYDKNISPGNPNYRQLIKSHADKYPIGIHPSWQSEDNSTLLINEIKSLEGISGKHIFRSRQHYIRMKLPATYRLLIDAGISEDYSMGYGSINGFRASYCLPYKWFDLEKNRVTSLSIFPFSYMEANSFYEQKYSAAETRQELEHYYAVTNSVNGLLITIWHNHFLGTDRMFAGWKEVYEEFVDKYFVSKM